MNKNMLPFHFCKTCGKKYFKSASVGLPKWNKSRFCSRKCINTNRIPPNKGKKMIDIAPQFIHGMLGKKHTAEAINKIKEKRALQITSENQLIALKENRWKNHNLSFKICEICNKEFRTYPGQLNKRKTCSRKCYGKYQSIHYTGKNAHVYGKNRGSKHPFWKGGISPINLSERKRFRREMQMLIFQRDNFTCVLCGNTGIPLTVDHIKKWSEFPKLRFNMDNCRTLCQKCHYKITWGKEMPNTIKTWGRNFNAKFK